MNSNLQQLFAIAQKKEKMILGLMSGTSLDGLDVALCRFFGSGMQTRFKLLQFETIAYNDFFKEEIRQVFSKKTVDLEKLILLNAYIGNLHGELVLQCLKKWQVKTASVDLVASHGQTIYHAPKHQHQQNEYSNATLQIGDGDHVAVKTGIITLSDFRQKHIAAGGEGAPLALYGDVILGSKKGENRLLLNLGGIANFTFLPADASFSRIISTDVGPGNTLIDAACRQYFDLPFDEDAKIALSGEVNEELLSALKAHPFFGAALPKSTGPELFNLEFVEKALQKTSTNQINPADLVATLTVFTAQIIADGILQNFPVNNLKVFVSGGGARNPLLIQLLQKLLPKSSIQNSAALGLSADAKEAVLFALLANEAVAGEPIVINQNPAVLMGKFSFPR
ncbi:anhydro-N-acetylmuramic acid kinase [Mucilaginibacter arboris]|uniref:Anhydro-N-acetylmuramic acid kinase n=1 Tax=Mucilaginibacter arboris TaxID=2682090 RepID=A0A7K1SZW1_9SPHI|nr:anhydro-N-acetylmuramic acid kinase [Mucilaginibacter arboris]MVN22855.1 anhydro-N-acetylmuramic acid kinase [Mucilaginibacter arboris]